jgi:aromatic-L-amino-acid decarboxylase
VSLKHVDLAKRFEQLVQSNDKYEIVGEVTMGLVCFRLKGENGPNEQLLKRINDEGKIHMVPSKIGDTYFLRLAVCAQSVEAKHVEYAWDVIVKTAESLSNE